MRFHVMLLAALLSPYGAPACATFSNQAQPEADTDTDTDTDDDPLCKEVEVTGSHIPQTVCATPEEVRDRQRQDQEEIERLQRNTPPSNKH